jgi:hypothetical protein
MARMARVVIPGYLGWFLTSINNKAFARSSETNPEPVRQMKSRAYLYRQLLADTLWCEPVIELYYFLQL